jgi:hypothetical protein
MLIFEKLWEELNKSRWSKIFLEEMNLIITNNLFFKILRNKARNIMIYINNNLVGLDLLFEIELILLDLQVDIFAFLSDLLLDLEFEKLLL